MMRRSPRGLVEAMHRVRPPARLGAFFAFILLVGTALSAQDYYWEAPRPLAEGAGRFPTALASSGGIVVVWQESSPRPAGEGEGGQAWLSLARLSRDAWTIRRRFAGPYDYRGSEPLLFSAASENGEVAIAAAAGDGAIEVLLSNDGGRSFRVAERPAPSAAAVAPRIFPSAQGGWLLFVTQGESESLKLFYSRSADGSSWEPFRPFVAGEEGLELNFLPSAARSRDAQGRPVDVVVFQSLIPGARRSFQLYSKLSTDGGRNWSPARRITDFPDPVIRERNAADNFDNQRPFLGETKIGLWLAWERATLTGQPQIYAMPLGADGMPRPGAADRVSSGAGSCSAPAVYELGGQPAVAWFDNRRGGNRVYFAQRRGADWPETELSVGRSDASFGRLAVAEGRLYAFWQSSEGSRDRIIALEPDTSAAPPSILALDWKPGTRTRRERATAQVSLAPDSSGFEGFSYVFSRDAGAEPPREVMALPAESRLHLPVPEDGTWWLAVAARDYAGNWSATTRVSFERDRTPPPPPLLMPPELDERGFLASNTFTVRWVPPEADDLAGYTWELRYAGGLFPAPTAARLPARAPLPGLSAYEAFLVERSGPTLPPPSLLGAEPRASYRNVDDGYYFFSVAAIDRTGNVGDTATIMLRADKFVPYTLVAYAEARRDDLGRTSLRVIGRGFSAEGSVTRLVLDRDGRDPYDLVRERSEGGFRVASDRELDGIAYEGLEEGRYRIGLLHPVRGWYWTAPVLAVDAAGTLKFGMPAGEYRPSWSLLEPHRYRFSLYDAIVLAAILFAGLGISLSLAQVRAAVADGAAIRREVLALVSGGPMPSAKKAVKARELERRGAGLRFKFTIIVAILVLLVVGLLAVVLGAYVIKNQSETLATGLRQRALVLLESVAQGGRSYLPAQNVLELGLLPRQAQAMEDASYITLSGYGSGGSTALDVVWASNDPGIADKIDSPALKPGVSVLADELSPRIPSIAAELDRRAQAEVGALNESIAAYTREGRALATRLDEASQRRLAEIADASATLEREIAEKLFALANASVGSEPDFDPATAVRAGGRYLFYKPILYRRGSDALYYRGMVRLEVSTDRIAAEVRDSTAGLIRITLIIAAAALAAGIAGAIFLASVIVRPIKDVIAAIDAIRKAEDKETLSSFSIEVRSHDELATLASAANELKRELVIAAKESKALEKGSDIQRILIPLDDAGGGKKYTTGKKDMPELEMFGYYKGAKKVSGDYWDFRPIGNDGRYFYFIKCDVSGKDVEAAFIMVQIVTLVTDYFSDFKPSPKVPDFGLTDLTYRVNDFLASRGYEAKFAAFTLGVISARDGELTLCHAGDNMLHFWRRATGRLEVETLHKAPATGPLPSSFFRDVTPYRTVKRRLNPGDILLLYTDGIEESMRSFRDADFQPFACTDVPNGEPHENHRGGDDSEELGPERLEAFNLAFDARGRYAIERQHDEAHKDELRSFDLSSVSGSLEERIIGMIALEKVWRLYYDPKRSPEDSIIIDKRVEAFLEKHFEQFRLLFRAREPITQKLERKGRDGKVEVVEIEDPNYVRYRGLSEDDQWDDLTLLGIRKK